jgi:hypothetical protein
MHCVLEMPVSKCSCYSGPRNENMFFTALGNEVMQWYLAAGDEHDSRRQTSPALGLPSSLSPTPILTHPCCQVCKGATRQLCGRAAAHMAATGGIPPRVNTVVADFTFRCLMQTTRSVPPSVQRTLMAVEGGGELVRVHTYAHVPFTSTQGACGACQLRCTVCSCFPFLNKQNTHRSSNKENNATYIHTLTHANSRTMPCRLYMPFRWRPAPSCHSMWAYSS